MKHSQETAAYLNKVIEVGIIKGESSNRAVLAFLRWMSTYTNKLEFLESYILKTDNWTTPVETAIQIISDDPLLLSEFMFNEITHLRQVIEAKDKRIAEHEKGSLKFWELRANLIKENTMLRNLVAPTKLKRHDEKDTLFPAD